jgi:hypothetical protein
MTANRLAYVVALTSDPSQISHPIGTEPVVRPLHISITPDGVSEGGGYGALLIVLRTILLVFMICEAMEFNEVMVLLACRFVVNIVGDVVVLTTCIFVANRLGDVMDTPAVMLDVIKLFMLPDKELKLKHPIVLAVIVPLDMNDVDIVLIVAV